MRLLTVDECKRVDLCAIAGSYGWVIDKTGGQGRSTQMRRRDRSKEIIVSKLDDGRWVFFARDGTISGSVIDFIQSFDGGNLGAVREKISRLVASGIQQPPILSFPTANQGAERRSKNRSGTSLPEDGIKTSAVEYLQFRGLTKTTIEHFRESWLEGLHGDVRFEHTYGGGSGYEYRGPAAKGFSTGGVKGFWCHLPSSGSATTLVVCESGIDAMSHAQLRGLPPDTAYVSTAGSFGPHIVAAIIELVQRLCAKLLVAFDSDASGDRMAEQLHQAARASTVDHRRERPPRANADWNNMLADNSAPEVVADEERENLQIV